MSQKFEGLLLGLIGLTNLLIGADLNTFEHIQDISLASQTWTSSTTIFMFIVPIFGLILIVAGIVHAARGEE